MLLTPGRPIPVNPAVCLVRNTSVNSARSIGPALFAGGEYVAQLWLFWVAPIIGAVVAGLLSRWMYDTQALVQTVVVEKRRLTT